MLTHVEAAPRLRDLPRLLSRPPLIEATAQGLRYAAYPDSIGGVILARLEDGWSTYFPRGSEAQGFWSTVYAARNADAKDSAFDRACEDFDGLMMPPADAHGAPADRTGDFWRWSAPDRRG